MRKPFVLLTVTALTALAALSSPWTARAGTLLALDLPALVAQSDYVVVANAQSEASRHDKGAIVTDVTLKVITSLKGAAKPGDTLIATHLGGAVDRVGLRVPGAAKFKLGQGAVVFLRRAEASKDLNVTGMSQGLMPIVGQGDSATVTPSESDATLMQRDADGKLVEVHRSTQPRLLRELLTEIEQLVKH
ncbi:MAG: hypothetical protein ABW321_01180 [Polyangiales bacterium]